MPIDPRTPVLVGAAAVQQREDDPARAAEPLDLMVRALEAAADDAGSRALLAAADSVRAPRGFWDYPDPCRQIATRLGAGRARTLVAELGILQTTLFGEAARDIAAGDADIILVTGGEAKYRALRAQITGTPAGLTKEPGEPDVVRRPEDDIISVAEINSGIAMPVNQYAMMDNALRAAEGRSVAAHRQEVAELWAGMSRVAAGNPDAWNREALGVGEIRDPVGGNRMLAFPYTKLHNSQWNVDQAAGLILCSAAAAERHGIPRDRWVLPLAVADSNVMIPMTERGEPHRSFGFRHAGARALDRAGLGIDDVAHLELYSCFPIAVRAQMREMGVAAGRAVTLTGGMAFAGGPLNNFVLQAMVTMVRTLRADPGSVGLVSAVSGMLTKQGVSLWSTEPRGAGFGFDDVSDAVEADSRRCTVVDGASGTARVVTFTVIYAGDAPATGILLCELDVHRRAIVQVTDPTLMDAMTREEFCGRRLTLKDGAVAAWSES